MSAALGNDGSCYLKFDTNHLQGPDHIKFSYHPNESIINFAFTSETWKFLGRKNQERFLVNKKVKQRLLLADIYIDKSALYRTDQTKLISIQSIVPSMGGTRVKFYLENNVPHFSIKKAIATSRTIDFINTTRRKIYELHPSLKTDVYNGCAQVPLDSNDLPVMLLCFGI